MVCLKSSVIAVGDGVTSPEVVNGLRFPWLVTSLFLLRDGEWMEVAWLTVEG